MTKAIETNGVLQGKIALIVGGASGIGAGMCLEFATQGATVAVADKNPTGAEAIAQQIQQQGARALAVQVDICDHQQVNAAVDRVLDSFTTIDILINCAGINQFKPAQEFSSEEWENIRSVNLDGTWNCCHAVMPEMIRKSAGKIVNIGSGSALRATPHAAPYVITKHGIAGLTKALAVDLGPHHINVNCICPASIDTPLLRQGTSAAYREAMTNRLPLGRLGRVSDITKAALFLVSPDADWITGVILPVDGGLNCCSFAHHVE